MKNLFKFKWLLLSFVLSIASINQVWADYTFNAGTTIVYDFSAVPEGVAINCWEGTIDAGYDANGGGKLKSYTFPSNTTMSTSWVIAKVDKGGWQSINFKAPSTGQNVLKIAADGKSFEWGTTTATKRTFQTGEKIYFKDTWKAKGNSSKWNPSGEYLFAYFYDNASPKNEKWVKCVTAAKGSFNEENTIYEIEVPKKGSDNHTWTGVIFTRSGSGTEGWSNVHNQTTDQAPAVGFNMFCVFNTLDNSKYVGEWCKYSPDYAVIGDFNNWDPESNVIGEYSSNVGKTYISDLSAATTYRFAILHEDTWKAKNDYTITNTTADDWKALADNNSNCVLTTDEAGQYIVRYNNSTHYMAVYYPQTLLTPGRVVYFDASNCSKTYWKKADFSARFWFRYYDSGTNVEGTKGTGNGMFCSVEDTLVGPVYYQTVVNNNLIGQIVIDREHKTDGTVWNTSGIADAYKRSSSAENCVYVTTDAWDPTLGWKTYCPPTTSETFADDGTSKISWQDGGNDGSTSGKAILVKTGTTLNVTASANKAVDDDNMTVMYDFQVNSESVTSQTSGSYTATASTNNTVYNVKMQAYTNYNLDNTKNSTKSTTKNLYYKALDMYSVTHTLSHATKSEGLVDDDAAAYHLPYTATFAAAEHYHLPANITVKFGETTKTVDSDFTWDSNTGVVSILADKIDGNVTIIINAEPDVYDIEYKDQGNVAFTGTHGDGYPTTHTYNTATDLVSPTKTGYAFGGWYKDADCTISAGSSLGATDYTDDITLYAKWIPVPLTFNGSVEDHETEWGQTDNWTPACVPTSAHDVIIASGATLAVPADKTIHDLTVKSGATLNITDGSGSGVTLTVNSLSLEGGWTEIDEEDVYDMPRVYIDPASTLTKTINIVNFDVAVDAGNYYPIAVPFPVTVGNSDGQVDYANPYYATYSTYGLGGQYVIKKYNGATRAANGAVSSCWEVVDENETLYPGIGYIMTALPVKGQTTAVIRFPMTVNNAWTEEGEKGSATISASTVTKNQVTVTAHVKDKGDTPKANKGWNLLGVPYMACYQTGTDMYSGGIIQGRFDYSTNTWKEENVRYVTVPTHDFSEYHQYDITDEDTKLLPEWCFFIQAETSGTLTFAADDRTNSGLIYAPKREQASMPTVKTGIILSGAEASDKTTFLVSDKYDGSEYEINADLEKMFGENSYTLATYSLMGSTRLAYNAMSNADALNIIPIGYRAPEDGDYTFSINPRYAENFAQVNLVDNQEGTVTNLLLSNYTFSTERMQNDARFALNVVPKAEIPTDFDNGTLINDENGVRKVLINNQMYIIRGQEMFDAIGKRVKEIR